MKPHEIIFVTSTFACILTWCLYQNDLWCERNIMSHQRSNKIRWSFTISASVFFVSLCYNAYLEWY
ncbi:hypothetical protein MPK64_gp058 [Erwinia phage pEa_SNUABM_16]|uniref:Uncharacterized protein n=1 Tax=Erwinia phage pEa_SNUABM_16 TaxID=2869544 RepID=A0AAE8XQQ2_9CAUD|nr:hypothetical protein MPK64_gp058 [Erwinia phage pEa_SNUABM_16]QZE58961.1 hypothetical protein pEaSNUABM18_00058 [Erwinia phage pEa_SNUABM_18]UAW96202.1 hypothetical protein pEaSNUABM16_00058 [Erwinia phage pEa_SNUABM_16]